MAKVVAAFGKAFAEHLETALDGDGWTIRGRYGTKKGVVWTAPRQSALVHKVYVQGSQFPKLLKVRLYLSTDGERRKVQDRLIATRSPLKGIMVTCERSEDTEEGCAFALDLVITGTVLGALPGMENPATAADHFHDLILAAETSGATTP